MAGWRGLGSSLHPTTMALGGRGVMATVYEYEKPDGVSLQWRQLA